MHKFTILFGSVDFVVYIWGMEEMIRKGDFLFRIKNDKGFRVDLLKTKFGEFINLERDRNKEINDLIKESIGLDKDKYDLYIRTKDELQISLEQKFQ